jgi:hypothetical protein
VSVLVQGGSDTTFHVQFNIADAPLSPYGASPTIKALPGVNTELLVGQFQDLNRYATLAPLCCPGLLAPTATDYEVTIDWDTFNGNVKQNTTTFTNDWAPAEGHISGDASDWGIYAYHNYASPGAYDVLITVKDVEGGKTVELYATVDVEGITQLQWDVVNTAVSGQNVNAGLVPPPAGTPPVPYNPNAIEIPMATFWAGPGMTPSDFVDSTINWGDGTTGDAIIQYLELNQKPFSTGNFMAVYYTGHVYYNPGPLDKVYYITLTIKWGPGFAAEPLDAHGNPKQWYEAVLPA